MLTTRTLLRYGVLGVPLAFIGLPVYVHVPKFYADVLHMNLAELGGLLLILRLFDAFFDPVIGMISDHYHRHARAIMWGSVPMLIAGYIALFNPPGWAFFNPVAWLAGCLTLVYLSFSTLMINYYAMGVDMAHKSHDHTRIAGFREGSMLLGVLLASMLPTLLHRYFDIRSAYGLFSLLLAPLLLLGAGFALTMPRLIRKKNEQAQSTFLFLLKYPDVRWVMTIGLFNSIPTAITSTLFLFFVNDILHAESAGGWLLALYFLNAACGMPLLTQLSLRWGKKRTLFVAMVAAIASFIWAYTLGPGDIVPFAIICVLSGLTLGADSIIMPSLLGDAMMHKREATATGFGLWNFTAKLTMAFAAGIVLPMLSESGYHSGPGNSEAALHTLSFTYALVPCMFKAVAALLLDISSLGERVDVDD